jgi:choline kinase
MKSYGPKPLIELSGRETVIGRQLRILRGSFPRAEIIVVVGYEAERVIKSLPCNIKIVENELHDQTNILRSIGMGLRVASHPNVLLVYGDLVFNTPAVQWACANGSSLLVDSKGQIGEDEVGANVVGGQVTNLSYGLPIKWAQIAFFSGRELAVFRRIAGDPDRRRHFGFEAINSVIDGGGRFRAIEPRGMRVAEIDSSKDIEFARKVDEPSSCPIVRVGG